MILHKKVFCIVSLGLLLGSSNLLAAEKTAQEVIKNAYQNIGAMQKYAFDAVVVDNAMVEGEAKQIRHQTSVKISRPGDLRIDTTGDIRNRTTIMHDGLFTMSDKGVDLYAQMKIPNNTDKVFDYLFTNYNMKTPLATLMYSDMAKRIKFTKSKYFGTSEVAGVECDYVAFKRKNKVIHVWVTTGENPLVKAYSIIEGDERMDTTLSWDTNPSFSNNDFIFTVPKGAGKIEIHRVK